MVVLWYFTMVQKFKKKTFNKSKDENSTWRTSASRPRFQGASPKPSSSSHHQLKGNSCIGILRIFVLRKLLNKKNRIFIQHRVSTSKRWLQVIIYRGEIVWFIWKMAFCVFTYLPIFFREWEMSPLGGTQKVWSWKMCGSKRALQGTWSWKLAYINMVVLKVMHAQHGRTLTHAHNVQNLQVRCVPMLLRHGHWRGERNN